MTRRVRLQVIAFCALAAIGVSYVAATYVGLGRMVGLSGYHVTVELPRTGGLFTNAEITYRGVPVGRVAELSADPGGVTARVVITDEDTRIPRDLDALVRNRSAIGEQYLDLRPRTDDGPWLADGDTLATTADQLPMPIDGLLENLVAFNRSLPPEDLAVVVDEMHAASQGAGDDLRSLLDAAGDVVAEAEPHREVTTSLIQRSAGVLRTQAETSDSLQSFSRDLDLLAQSLADSDDAVRRVLADGPQLAGEMQSFIAEVGAPAATFVRRLLAVDQVLALHASDLRTVLDRMPALVEVVDRVLGPSGLRFGLVTNLTDPPPCTQGYAQPRRGPEQTDDVPLRAGPGCGRAAPR